MFLHIPLPKMRPIVLAALAISDGLDVPTLVSHGHKILKGLMEKEHLGVILRLQWYGDRTLHVKAIGGKS